MNVKIEDYVSWDEIKEICVTALRDVINKDSERILSNLAYHVAFKIVDSAIGEEQIVKIKESAIRVITGMTERTVFRRADHWEKQDSIAYCELQKACKENTDVINRKVKDAIENRDYSKDVEANGDSIAEVIANALWAGLKK